MPPGLPDRVDCARLADEAAVLERVFALEDMPRLFDVLAARKGSVAARYEFERVDGGRAGATVFVEAAPQLVCQRCLKGFAFPVKVSSEIEFASSESAAPADSQREIFLMIDGLVSLRELAEEELLLALPVIAACNSPQACGRAPVLDADTADAPRRPFAGLQEMLKKT
jgi:uncharacterized protein